jgi:hypothetical protein
MMMAVYADFDCWEDFTQYSTQGLHSALRPRLPWGTTQYRTQTII